MAFMPRTPLYDLAIMRFSTCFGGNNATSAHGAPLAFADILKRHAGEAKSSMHKDVDDFVALIFAKGEADLLARYVFEHPDIDTADAGHLTVLGYVFHKYCTVDIPVVVRFLINLERRYGVNYFAYTRDLKRYFGLVPQATPIGMQFKKAPRRYVLC